MKKSLLALALLAATYASATTWEVEVGGNNDITPYFLPQNLNILVGDVIEWTWASGQHDLATTNGDCPDPFASDSHTAPFTWTKTFTLAGTYDYECTLFDHNETQFGTIIVGTNSVKEIEPNVAVDFSVYPNPANDLITIDKNCTCQTLISIYDLTGKVVFNMTTTSALITGIDISTLTQGIYFVELNASGNISRKRLVVR